MLLVDWPPGARPSQSDLADALGIDKSNVARLCARMEDKGHIRQVRAPNDARSRLLELTSAGARLARSVDRASLDRFSVMLDRIPSGRHSAVIEALASLNAALAALNKETTDP